MKTGNNTFRHRKAIENHIAYSHENPEEIKGYSVMIYGTLRCSYVGVDGGITYEESSAFVGPKDKATDEMKKYYKDLLWKYMRLMPIMKGRHNPEFKIFPTYLGY